MSDTVNTVDTEPRNTMRRGWFFTWNSYPEDWKQIIRINCEKFVAQPEVGDTGNHHIQATIYFKNARTHEQCRKIFPGANIKPIKNAMAAMNYCRKHETRTAEGIDNVVKKVKDPLEGKLLHEWQTMVLNRIAEPAQDRTINWIVDEVGNAGKTALAKHLCLTRDDCLYLTGKCADMKYGVFKWLQKRTLKVAILDFTRSQESFISYQGIEEIKNGIFYNTKYESEMCIYDSPHVIIFANFWPEMDKLSADRWNIVDLNANTNTADTQCFDIEVEIDSALTTAAPTACVSERTHAVCATSVSL